jgi:cytochrome c-type biogenesis protein
MAGVSYVVAFGGGVASFASPCVLPVVPAYLSTISGIDLADLSSGARQHLAKIVRDTLLFIGGFGVVFVLLGVSATAAGETLFKNQRLLTTVSGVLVIVMALVLAGSLVLRAPGLYREVRFHPELGRLGPFAAPIAGAAFGLGWTPCIGPVLASVLAVSSTERGVGQGAALLLVYTAGFGVPFLALGLGFSQLAGAVAFVRRRSAVITAVSAVILGAFGVLLVLHRVSWVTSELESALRAVGLGGLVNAG